MIGIQELINLAEAANTGTTIELAQLSKAYELERQIKRVSSLANLPAAASNTGIWYYVDSINEYRYSNGFEWTNSTIPIFNTIWAWGANGYGQLGDGFTINRSSPVSLIPSNFVWKNFGGGWTFSIAIKSDGTLWSWGGNWRGQLGDGLATITEKSSPVSLASPANSWSWQRVAGGYAHALAIRSDNTLWAWGRNLYGQLGNNLIDDTSSPVSLIAPANSWTWKKISSGSDQSIAIKSDNTLWVWGQNNNGQLGDGTTIDKSSPISLIAPANSWTWVSIANTRRNSYAIRSDGTLWAWGWNNYGHLGNGFTEHTSSPVSLIAPANSWEWKQISGGYRHITAIKNDNTLWAWGYNGQGQVGDGTTDLSIISPVSVLGGFTWSSVECGGNFTAAIKSDNTLWVWGKNYYGLTGQLPHTSVNSPVSFPASYFNSSSLAWKKINCGYAKISGTIA